MRLSLTGATWSSPVVPPENIVRLRARTLLSDVAARCLAIRLGDAPPDPAWLEPSIEHLHDPHAMRNMDAALDRLKRAIRDRERIRVVTDYDVDGTTSSLILQAALRLAGGDVGQVDYHIPDRFSEGYGFSVAAANSAAEAKTGLIVTADIGVRDHAAVAAARNRGVDVLICDHHLPAGAEVPSDATVLCPPQSGDGYPNPALAACGISLKVAQALLAGHAKGPALIASLLKLAAIGTVADLVPLTTLENRAIVALGLRELNRGPHSLGLQALLDASGLEPGGIRESDLGFRIGPRINAAGRIADAKLVVELLTSRDPEHARALAKRIDALNTNRRDIQKKLAEDALIAVGDDPAPFVVVAGNEHEGWHRGVVGIVASRLKDELHRPVAVVSIQGDRAVGSIRSVPGVHAVKALDSVRELLEKYGGHPVAAGFTVPTARLDALREGLCAYVRDHAAADALSHVREVDAELTADALTDPLHRELEALGPFGQGNPRPRLVVRGVRARQIEVRGDHGLLKFEIPRTGTRAVEAVWWDRLEHAPIFSDQPLDLLGELTEHRWKGSRRLQFQLSDARIAGA
jgi:single-stranded-DNA-specific exonuclease